MIGWIKLHRGIRDHWIWSDPNKFQWWLTMIIECTFKDSKMFLGSKLYDVKRGQSTNSIRRWSELFGVGTKATMNFFSILESENMIKKETLGIGKYSTTLITIVNYESYQSNEETQGATQGKRKGGTLEEGKEFKEDNIPSIQEVIEYVDSKGYTKEHANKIYEYYHNLNWYNSKGKKVSNWKNTILNNWLGNEGKKPPIPQRQKSYKELVEEEIKQSQQNK